jgi:uncharacterized membrane protein
MLFDKPFLQESERNALVESIRLAENNTSGEIRVHLEANCNQDPYERALEVFYELGMQQTEARNAVLIYIAHKDHKLAIVGDSAIHAVVQAGFWQGLIEVMQEHFKKGSRLEGLQYAVRETGMHLKQYFPFQRNDQNELSDEISGH